MIIAGIQKLTALDFPDTLACTVFLGGCNLRCPFCHNASLVGVGGNRISEKEFFDFLTKRQGILSGVCISGGEPLLQSEIVAFVKQITDLEYKVKIDTNGSFPQKLKQLCESGLVDYVAMDIKNSPLKYAQTCGRKPSNPTSFFERFKQSIEILKGGSVPYEFRTTVVNELHTLEDIEAAGKVIQGAEKWFFQCFQDSGDLLNGENLSPPSKDTLEQMRSIALKYVKTAEIRGI